MIGEYTEQQHADMLHRDRAQAMREALSLYQAGMRRAVRASLFHGDENSADGFRADARAALHMFPALLAMVEPPTHPYSPNGGLDGSQSIMGLVERVGEWTGR